MNLNASTSFNRDGFSIDPTGIGESASTALIDALSLIPRDTSRGGIRHLLNVPEIAALASHPSIRKPIEAILGSDVFAFKATYFEKSPGSNWFVGWHQDDMIPVAKKLDVPGFSRWSEKSGVTHAQPPAGILERIVAVRVNLDASTSENGALDVLPGSHRNGLLSDDDIATFIESTPRVPCLTPAGGLIFMRPLLLHASSRMTVPASRRVIHFEFVADALPGGLEWHTRVALA